MEVVVCVREGKGTGRGGGRDGDLGRGINVGWLKRAEWGGLSLKMNALLALDSVPPGPALPRLAPRPCRPGHFPPPLLS